MSDTVSAQGQRDASRWVVPLLVAAITVITFVPGLHGQFLNWDDEDNFVHNRGYRGFGAEQVRWMFTTFHMGHYHPLTWISISLDHAVWGVERPVGWHLTNLLLHGANAVMLYLVILALLRASPWGPALRERTLRLPAAAGALLFGVHPLRVESVVWITERRDVLSGLFFLMCILAYLRKSATSGRTSSAWYGISIAACLLSLMSKAWAMTLPVTLLVLDVFPLRRFTAGRRIQCLVEKVPYALLGAAAAALAILAQRHTGAMTSLRSHDFLQRAAQAMYGLAFYLWKTALPVALSPLYPREIRVQALSAPYIVSALGVSTAIVVLWVRRKSWPAVAVAFAIYVVTVSPVLGIAQSGPQIAADRYSYLALMPMAVLAAAGLVALSSRVAEGRTSRDLLTVAAIGSGVALVALAGSAWDYSSKWTDSITLFDHAVRVNPRNALAYYNRGEARHRKLGDLQGAWQDYDVAIEINPAYARAFVNRGLVKMDLGNLQEAIGDFDRAVRFEPNLVEAYLNRGVAWQSLGDPERAAQDFTRVLDRQPDHALALANRGLVAYEAGRHESALADLDRSIALRPEYGNSYLGRALVRQAMGNAAGALDDGALALRNGADAATAHNTRGVALRTLKDYAPALGEFTRAAELKPGLVDAHVNRAGVLRELDRMEESRAAVERALQLSPGHPMALLERARQRVAAGDLTGARADAGEASRRLPKGSEAHRQAEALLAAAGPAPPPK